MVNFNEFLDIIIHQQGDSRDIYEEIMQGFKMFDYGKCKTYLVMVNYEYIFLFLTIVFSKIKVEHKKSICCFLFEMILNFLF